MRFDKVNLLDRGKLKDTTKKKLVATIMRFDKVNLLDRGKLKDTPKTNQQQHLLRRIRLLNNYFLDEILS